ncbi:MAG TPA: ATP-binding protein [Terriglobales bacterium]|nr:ATP-binding protein [Terriglobales bacterium]
MAMISFLLCAASLLIVRASVQREVKRQTQEAVDGSVRAFTQFERQEDSQLLRTAALLSELPPLKALMTAPDRLTVQDGSREFWALSGSDLLVLANASGQVMALHSQGPQVDIGSAQRLFQKSLIEDQQIGWWQSGKNLYRITVRAISAGAGQDERVLGELLLGKQVDDLVAERIRHFSGNEITLLSGSTVIASTLGPEDQKRLAAILQRDRFSSSFDPQRYTIGNVSYEAATVILQTTPATPIRCLILLPLESTDAFLRKLNWTIVVLGIVIGLLGAAIMMLISRAITKPLETLAAAVKAMASGDDSYSVPVQGTSEVTQLSSAFDRMRLQVAESQRKQLEAERLAALGRAAGSISHDLRHILAALVANAEFLRDAEEMGCDRNEVYEELQKASAQMTGLIDSLVEVAREGHHLRLSNSDFSEVVNRAVALVRNNREFRGRTIELIADGDSEGIFDAVRLERAIFNLLLNACQAVDPVTGKVRIEITSDSEFIEVSISDNGPGLPTEVRQKLFQPFVTVEKPNGTGLGLAIASKIMNDHQGILWLDTSSLSGTTFRIRLPRWSPQAVPQEFTDTKSPALAAAELHTDKQNTVL